MTVKDILPANSISIMVRVFLPEHIVDFPNEDTLFGYCEWDGEKLISHDGDSYELDDEIVKWEVHVYDNEPYIVYWLKTGEWI